MFAETLGVNFTMLGAQCLMKQYMMCFSRDLPSMRAPAVNAGAGKQVLDVLCSLLC